MSREYTSVHDAHCCKIHGCKYGDDSCPVFAGDEEGVQCEDCSWEENDPATIELKAVKQQRDELLAALKELEEYARGFSVSGVYLADEIEGGRLLKNACEAIAKAEGLTP